MNKIEAIKSERDGLTVRDLLAHYAQAGWEAIPEDDIQRLKWYGLFLPPKASAELVQRASAALRGAMAGAEVADGLAAFGLDVSVNSPAELAKAVKEENAAWGPIVKRVGFTPEA